MPKKSIEQGLPTEVKAAIKQLGRNLKIARKRRRDPQARLARRLFTSSSTLRRLESGDPAVSIGTVATALWALGLLPQFRRLAHPDDDTTGKALELQRLPKSIRMSRAELDDDF
jgi:transcriptional regulator with XRE-family HTH domain